MKSLHEYIGESREVLGDVTLPLSKSEFYHLCRLEVGEVPFDVIEYNKYKKNIQKKFGKGAWMNLLYYISGNYKNNADHLYDDLLNMPKERFDRLLNSGAYGSVVDLGNGKVIKWFHKLEPLRDHDRIFYEWCKNNTKYKCFPVVYRLTDSYVVMEKLHMGDRMAQKYNSFIKTKVDYRDVVNFVEKGIVPPKFRPSEQPMWDWHVETYKGLKDAGLANHYPGDMHSGNIGVRDNGEIVWFDI